MKINKLKAISVAVCCLVGFGGTIFLKPCHAIEGISINIIGSEIREKIGGWVHPSRITLNRVDLIKFEELRTPEGRLSSLWKLEGPMPKKLCFHDRYGKRILEPDETPNEISLIYNWDILEDWIKSKNTYKGVFGGEISSAQAYICPCSSHSLRTIYIKADPIEIMKVSYDLNGDDVRVEAPGYEPATCCIF
jgi:hypothetical protein